MLPFNPIYFFISGSFRVSKKVNSSSELAPNSTRACLSLMSLGLYEIIFFKDRLFGSEKNFNTLSELKKNPTPAKVKIKNINKILADDFIVLGHGRDMEEIQVNALVTYAQVQRHP